MHVRPWSPTIGELTCRILEQQMRRRLRCRVRLQHRIDDQFVYVRQRLEINGDPNLISLGPPAIAVGSDPRYTSLRRVFNIRIELPPIWNECHRQAVADELALIFAGHGGSWSKSLCFRNPCAIKLLQRVPVRIHLTLLRIPTWHTS
jgi:hypothetical protein